MKLREVEVFARRQWADAQQRHEYWAERFRVEGPGPARKAADVLRTHARSINSSIFDATHRSEDLDHHLRLCGQLSRAGRAITGR